MVKVTALFGGHSGIGSAIKSNLIARGDLVYTFSRSQNNDPLHYQVNLDAPVNLPVNLKINYLIFAHRYRGKNPSLEHNIMVQAVENVVNHFKNYFYNDSSIVIIGSNSSDYVFPEQSSSYHSSRGAIKSLTKYLAYSLGKNYIRCNCVIPSTLIKPENQDFFIPGNPVRKLIEEITPLSRMGTANDIANAVEFLCSEKSSFITGQTFIVDGGLSIVSQEAIARNISKLEHSK
ncbi:SDR family oxidoreductase [Polynucleobacter sp. IMCC30063]|uniref:SDR family oxidoreductase n=1 Tax=Polynucleobacter sp. IMCC30063 TaxID=2907298 RepID=UPI001F362B44|nr:SDR family oxidoreductase [Polynucleobacter sp. IMCC30063]MCE7505280.1 SDR family oxidoreductase [Polynucleobacter sp. IMCC30063]